MKTESRSIPLVAVLCLAAACSTSKPAGGSGVASGGGESDAGVLMGPAGGTFTTPDGVTVQIPAGALSSNVTITVTPAPNAPLPKGAQPVGEAYAFGPEGTQFQRPVTVTLPFDPTRLRSGSTADNIIVYTAPAGSANYTPLTAGPVDATHVQAETTHFSTIIDAVLPCWATLMGCPPTAFGTCIGEDPSVCMNPCTISWGCGGNGWCAPLCSGDCHGFCSGSSGSGSSSGSGTSSGSSGGSGAGASCNSGGGDAGGGGSSSGGSSGGGGASSFVGTWACQDTTTLTNTSPGAGPMTIKQPTVWTITAGANGQIAIVMTTTDGGTGEGPCDYDATVSGSVATLPAGQTCIPPPITGSDGVAKTYTITLSSCSSVTVSGDAMAYSIAAVVGDNTCPQGCGTVTQTSTGTCAK